MVTLTLRGTSITQKSSPIWSKGAFFTFKQLKLWEGGSFLNLGIILADVQITFRKVIQFGDPVRVGVRISRLGNKSMTSEYRLEDARDSS